MDGNTKIRRALLLSWLIPLLLLFFAPTAVIGVLHNNSINAVRREAEHVYTSELTNLKNIVDFHLADLNRIALDLSRNRDVLSFISADRIGPHERMLSYFVQNRLRDYSFTNFAVSYVAIGNFNTDFVISNMSSYSMQEWKAIRLDYGSISSIQLDANVHINKYTILRDPTSNREFISYTLSLPLELGSRHNAFVTIFISSSFTQLLADGLVDRTFFIKIGDNTLQVGNDVHSSGHTSLQLESAISGIRYGYAISTEYNTTIQRIRLITWISATICILLCISILVFFFRKNYMPIARIAREFGDDSGTTTQGNKLSHIELTLTNRLRESKRLRTELEKHMHVAQDGLIAKLLLGDTSENELSDMSMHASFGGELFFVAAIKSSEFRREEDDLLLLQNTIKKMLGDLQTGGFNVNSLVLHGAIIAVFSCGREDIGFLLSHLKKISVVLELPFDTSICVGVSQPCERIEDISSCYSQAEETLSYCVMFNRSYAVYKTDYRASIDYAFRRAEHFEESQKFRNSIVNADFKGASQVVDALFNTCFYPDQPVIEVRLNIYSIVMLFCSALVEFSKRHDIDEMSIEKINSDLLQTSTIDQLKLNITEQLCTLAERHKDVQKYLLDQFNKRVIQYIAENYHNYELSVSGIAEHFNVSVSYTSKVFKELMGVGLLNYIHQVRLKHAKELLSEKMHSVKEIATMVGFNDASSFIRTFKKYEGVSPGKYL